MYCRIHDYWPTLNIHFLSILQSCTLLIIIPSSDNSLMLVYCTKPRLYFHLILLSTSLTWYTNIEVCYVIGIACLIWVSILLHAPHRCLRRSIMYVLFILLLLLNHIFITNSPFIFIEIEYVRHLYHNYATFKLFYG